MPHPLVNSAA